MGKELLKDIIFMEKAKTHAQQVIIVFFGIPLHHIKIKTEL